MRDNPELSASGSSSQSGHSLPAGWLQQEAGRLHHSPTHAKGSGGWLREAGLTLTGKVWPSPLQPEVALPLPPAPRQAGPLFLSSQRALGPGSRNQSSTATPSEASWAVTSAQLTPFGVSPLGEQGQLCISQMKTLKLPLSPQPVGCYTVVVTDTEGALVVTRVGQSPSSHTPKPPPLVPKGTHQSIPDPTQLFPAKMC